MFVRIDSWLQLEGMGVKVPLYDCVPLSYMRKELRRKRGQSDYFNMAGPLFLFNHIQIQAALVIRGLSTVKAA